MPAEDYSHMAMVMKLMVDGDGVDDDGDEDGDKIPLSGVESRINLTPKTEIVVVAALCIANRSPLLGLRVFRIYEEVCQRRGRDDAVGPKETRWRAPGGWARHLVHFCPRGSFCVIPKLYLFVS